MKKPFEVGERVAVYETRWDAGKEPDVIRKTGVIKQGPNQQGIYLVQVDPKYHSAVHVAAHPRDLIRLVKKERRRTWIHNLDTTGATATHARILYEDPHDPDYREFREVKRNGK